VTWKGGGTVICQTVISCF